MPIESPPPHNKNSTNNSTPSNHLSPMSSSSSPLSLSAGGSDNIILIPALGSHTFDCDLQATEEYTDYFRTQIETEQQQSQPQQHKPQQDEELEEQEVDEVLAPVPVSVSEPVPRKSWFQQTFGGAFSTPTPVPQPQPQPHANLSDQANSKAATSHNVTLPPPLPLRPLTYLMLGLTGAGKSLTGSFLSDCPFAFDSSRSFHSVTSELKGLQYSYGVQKSSLPFLCIDSPGFLDTRGDTVTHDAMCHLARAAPHGLDAIVVVVDGSQRFTEESCQFLRQISTLFGEHVWEYCVFVFTRSCSNDIQKEIADLPEGHYLRTCCEKANWRVWKTENHQWLAQHLMQEQSNDSQPRKRIVNNVALVKKGHTARSPSKEQQHLPHDVSQEHEKDEAVEFEWKYVFDDDDNDDALKNKKTTTWENKQRLEGKMPKEYSELTFESIPSSWLHRQNLDRLVIHQLLLKVKKNHPTGLDHHVFEAVREARRSLLEEYQQSFDGFVKEKKHLEKLYWTGKISKQDFDAHTQQIQQRHDSFKTNMQAMEIERTKHAIETKHQILRTAGRTSITLLGAAGVAAAVVAATSVVAAAAPSIAATGFGAWFLSRAASQQQKQTLTEKVLQVATQWGQSRLLAEATRRVTGSNSVDNETNQNQIQNRESMVVTPIKESASVAGTKNDGDQKQHFSVEEDEKTSEKIQDK